jgi:hypothetical protein
MVSSRSGQAKQPLTGSVHCSLGERAFTDLVTNATTFTDFDLPKDLTTILPPSAIPPAACPALLHESVHHWCFMTPVGAALSALIVRSQMLALQWSLDGRDETASAAYMAHLSAEGMMALLRPLAEGMALFAEYDVMPYPQTPVISTPMSWIYVLFARPTLEELEKSYGRSLMYHLSDQRLSERVMRRKADLLLQPLATSRGGYLPGYLSVKGLWREAFSRCAKLHDADLFYSFLRRYIYGDYGLVRQLLEPEGGVGVMSWVSYLRGRVEQFLQLDFEKEVDRFIETTLTDEGPRESGHLVFLSTHEPIATLPMDHKRGRELLVDLTESLLAEPMFCQLGEAASTARFMHAQSLAFRHLLWFGQMPVDIRRADESKVGVSVGGSRLFDVPTLAAAAADEIERKGTIDVYVAPYGNFWGLVVAVDGRAVAVHTIGGSAEDVARFRGAAADRKRVESFQDQMKETLRILLETTGRREVLSKARQLFDHGADLVYRDLAMIWARRKDAATCYESMQSDGVFGLLKDDLKLLKATAALSIGAALRMTPEEMAPHMPPGATPVGEALPRLKQISEACGFPLVFGTAGQELVAYV